MKKIVKALSIVLAMITVLGCMLTGCGGSSSTKTVLYVWNYDGGVGSAWLNKAIERFEALHENDTSYQEGKTGVKISVTPTKNEGDLDKLKTSKNVVYFAQGIKFNERMRKGELLNIDSVVTGNIESENKTIESKLDLSTQKALKAQDGHYYALPHYQSYDGVVYNRTMFEENGFFLVEDINDSANDDPARLDYGFVDSRDASKKNDKSIRTVGPDGVKCTHADDVKCECDDGLPSSVEEFKRLVKYIKYKEIAPFIWMDGSNKSYQLKFTNAVWANLEGYDGVMANFTFDSGVATTKIVTNTNTMETENIAITKENAYKLYQQESKYYALDLSEFIFKKANRYYHEDYSEEGESPSNVYIQQKFLEGEAAMMLEGSYWENELKTVGTYPVGAEELDIRMMPLPVQATGSVTEGNGKKAVQIDTLESYAFISKHAAERQGEAITRLAKDFLQFLYTDESLAEFTEKSSAVKNLNYTISGTQKALLSPFAQSVYDSKLNDKIVVPISDSPIFYKNQGEFSMYSTSKLWLTKIEGIEEESPYSGLRKTSAKDYFTNMAKKSDWLSKLAGYND